MTIWSVVRLALANLWRNPLRSFLTALGIIIAIGSVMTMAGLVDGANASIQAEIARMGTNMIIITPGSANRGGHSMGIGTMATLMPEDAEAMLEECPSVRLVTPWVRGVKQAVFSGRNWATFVMGTNETFLEIREWPVVMGRNFSEAENRAARKVCLIGQVVREKLFGDVYPVGRIIRIGKMPFEVIGVLGEKGQTGFGEDQDDRILAPFLTVQKRLLGISHAHMILTSASSEDRQDEAKAEMQALLRRRHGLDFDAEDDFTLSTQADLGIMAGSILQIVEMFLTGVASVSLIVGGINIMNVMLIAVRERTREIGVRMAIGARQADILKQFLVEAVVLSTMGGGVGIVLGMLLTHGLIRSFTEWQATISLSAIGISVVFSAGVGIFFGLYPAWKASQLDPIEALRFE